MKDEETNLNESLLNNKRPRNSDKTYCFHALIIYDPWSTDSIVDSHSFLKMRLEK